MLSLNNAPYVHTFFKKMNVFNKLAWAIPISFYALDANAWGLYTHIYFSQYLLLAVPLSLLPLFLMYPPKQLKPI